MKYLFLEGIVAQQKLKYKKITMTNWGWVEYNLKHSYIFDANGQFFKF